MHVCCIYACKITRLMRDRYKPLAYAVHKVDYPGGRDVWRLSDMIERYVGVLQDFDHVGNHF